MIAKTIRRHCTKLNRRGFCAPPEYCRINFVSNSYSNISPTGSVTNSKYDSYRRVECCFDRRCDSHNSNLLIAANSDRVGPPTPVIRSAICSLRLVSAAFLKCSYDMNRELKGVSRGGVRSTRGLGPTMTARGQNIGI